MKSRPIVFAVMAVLSVLVLFAGCASQSSQTAPMAPEQDQPQSEEAARPAAPSLVIDQASLTRDTQAYLDNLEVVRIFYEDVYFDYDSAELKPPAVAELKHKADWLQRHPEVKVIIEGHCDERGSNEHNLALGEKRAGAIKSFLIGQGIDSARLSTISYGEERPVDEGHTEEAWAKNRRGHLALPSR